MMDKSNPGEALPVAEREGPDYVQVTPPGVEAGLTLMRRYFGYFLGLALGLMQGLGTLALVFSPFVIAWHLIVWPVDFGLSIDMSDLGTRVTLAIFIGIAGCLTVAVPLLMFAIGLIEGVRETPGAIAKVRKAKAV